MSYVVCLIYCIAVRLVLILLVYVYLFQHYCTGAKMKTRLSDVVSVQTSLNVDSLIGSKLPKIESTCLTTIIGLEKYLEHRQLQ